MRILIAGANGVIGSRLVPLLVAEGHDVLGLSRNTNGASAIRGAGAQARACDVYDLDRLTQIAFDFSPEAVVHQVTDLPDDARLIDDAANSRIRITGTDNLLAAARVGGARLILAQSVAWPLDGAGGQAVAYLEGQILHAHGVVVRYGRLYGPDTYHPVIPPDHPRVHVDDAAARTLALINADSGIYTVVEEQPQGSAI